MAVISEIKNIVVFGTGAVGAMLANFLQASNHEGKKTIHLVGRPSIVDQIQKEGLIYVPFGAQENDSWLKTSGFSCHHSIVDVPRADVIFLTMKAHALEAGLTEAKHLFQSSPPIIFITMNGLGLKEVVAKFVPQDHIIETVVNYPSRLDGNRVYNDGGNSNVMVEDLPLLKEILPLLFSPNTLDIRQEPEFELHKWEKALMNIGMNGISAIPMLKVGEVLDRPPLGAIIKQLIRETVAIAKEEGITYKEDMVKFFWRFAGRDPDHYTSTYFDLSRGKPTEIDFMNGFIVRRGKALGIPVPANDALYNLMQIVEQDSK